MTNLLIVEDDQIISSIYRNKFAQEGYTVESVPDGESAIALLKQFQPAVVLLDLVLPNMGGVEVIRHIRRTPELAQVPVVVFSNTYLPRVVQDARDAGATKCLSKTSCTPREVIEVVRKLVSAPPAAASPSSPAPVNTVPGAAPAAKSEGEFQENVRQNFLNGLPQTSLALRTALQAAIKTESEVLRRKRLEELYKQMHTLANSAGVAGCVTIAQMADALEALLKELCEKPKNINSSTLRTLANAIDFIDVLFRRTGSSEEPAVNGSQILVVDDEAISRRAVSHALEKADLRSVTVGDPQVAWTLLQDNQFDLVFLDVDMPGMTGFELCAKLRTLPAHKKTPVVFVTGLNDFESRANSTISGGNDLIAKPFLFIELAVKSLVYIIRGHLEPARSAPGGAAAPTTGVAVPVH